MDRPPLDAALVERVQASTVRYLQVLDTLTEEGRRAPSLLPGWTRGHVVAHLARNGMATAEVLDELVRGRDATFYESAERRAADVDSLATADLATLRERTLEAAGRCRDSLDRVRDRGAAALADRRVRVVPGAAWSMDVTETVLSRWREVEIHHADLAGGYGPADWPAEFTRYVLEMVVEDRGEECDLLLVTPERDIPVGSGDGPRIDGMPAGLAWWLLGRPSVPELTGRLPRLAPWESRDWLTASDGGSGAAGSSRGGP